MKRRMIFLAAILISIIFTGCGATTTTIMMMSKSERTDVFKEIASTDSMPQGYAALFMTANIKTHIEGYFNAESRTHAHGKPAYPFLFNIDGQSVVWNAPGALDKKPIYDENGKTSLDPEAGEGMKYLVEKKLQLPIGKHRVFFGLAEESYYTTAEIELKEGGSYTLEFKPVYSCKTFPTRIPNFLRGLRQYDVVLQ